MTKYGTIPSTSLPPPPPPPSSSANQYVSLAKQHIRSGLDTCRPWRQTVESLSLPQTATISFSRMRTNLVYFRSNYTITILLTVFLSLLYHPTSLIVFVLTMSAWLFLYFLRDDPIVILDRLIDDGTVLLVLSSVTIGLLLLTDVTVNITVGMVIGVAVVLAHGAVRGTDDLLSDEEGGGVVATAGSRRARVVLRDTASDLYSSAPPS